MKNLKATNKKAYFYSIIGDLILRLIYNSNDWHISGEKNYLNSLKNGKSVLISCWHGQLLSCLRFLSNNNYNAIAGTHNDAEIISKIAKKWGYRIIRGSNKKNGAVAYKKIINVLKKSPDVLFITPDGPSGPARIPKLGIIRAAKKTDSLIVPASVYSTKKWGFKNWDTFFVEKPFGKIYLRFGEPIILDKNFSDDNCSRTLINHMNINEGLNKQFAKDQIKK